MGWKDIVNEIDNRYSFFTKVKAARNGLSPCSIHPVLRISSGMVISAMFAKKSNRILLLFPHRFNLDKWITILSVLELLKNEYCNRKPVIFDFKPKQKLLLNNKYVVEYEGAAEGKIWVKTSDSSTRIGLNIGKKLQFQSTTKTRLSPAKKVWGEYNNAPNISIDSILNIYTAGNKSFFSKNIIYVGRIGKTVEFINNNEVNNTKLSELFLWGKLNAEGDLSTLGSGGVQAKPSCIIAPDLYSVVNYCAFDEDKSRAIIISSTSLCAYDPPSFNALVDCNIPIIVITDFTDLDDLETLKDSGFRIWQWDERNLAEISKQHQSQENSIFTQFHRTLTNMCNQKIEIAKCYYPDLDSVVEDLISFEAEIQQEHDELKSLFPQLFQINNIFSRLIRYPSVEWLNNYQEKLKNLQHQIQIKRLWIPPNAMSKFTNLISSLFQISSCPFANENHKLVQFENLLRKNSNAEKTIVIIPQQEDIDSTKNYWQEKCADIPNSVNNLIFMTAGDLSLDSSDSAHKRIIVCGWLGQGIMYSILNSYVAENIVLLLYPNEVAWFRSTSNRWEKKRKIKHSFIEFSDLMNLPVDLLNSIEPDFKEKSLELEDLPEENIVEFELRLNQYRYSSYNASSISNETIEKAKLVVFSDDRFSFFTKTHKSLVVTELISDTDAEIQKVTLTDIKTGDYLLFYASDKDLIREFADKGLANAGKSNLREIANIWKKALHRKLESFNYNETRLVSDLKAKGCQRHYLTIQNWLYDVDIIGPGIVADLDIIAKATQDTELQNNLDTVRKAISKVRGAHHQASTFLAQQLIAKLPEIISEEGGITKSLTLDITGFGRVFILRVEHIGNEWIDVEKNNTNKLLL